MKKDEKKKQAFTVKGQVKIGTKTVPFAKNVNAYNEKHAAEQTKSLFGSKNNVKRRNITIKETHVSKE